MVRKAWENYKASLKEALTARKYYLAHKYANRLYMP